MSKLRDDSIDFMKGIATIAVVFYHLGICTNGYLGVDIFLVINGHLIMDSVLCHEKDLREFSFTDFAIKRLVRLQPVLLAGCILAMFLGYFVMLPDDYQGLGETAVASVCEATNILQAITTHNYWDAVQDFKPLMHTWYLGVVVQFYMVYGIYTKIICRFCKADRRVYLGGMIVLTAVSFILYILPGDPADRFYYLRYRFWEPGLGAVLALCMEQREIRLVCNSAGKIAYGSAIVMMVLLFLPLCGLPKTGGLIFVVCCTFSFLFARNHCEKQKRIGAGGGYVFVCKAGICSYSIYIWHQIIIAFYRYCIDGNLGIAGCVLCTVLTVIMGTVSYVLIEKRLTSKLKSMSLIALCISISGMILGSGMYVYLKGGVMRNVPELDVFISDVHRGMHSAYNDRVYAMDVEFSEDDRIKVLAVGNSFVRDWCNVLMESDIAAKLDISYVYGSAINEEYACRIARADYIFVNGSMVCEDKIPECIEEHMANGAEIWSVGTKCYGVSNGNIYNRRYREEYLQMTASYADVSGQYQEELRLCGERYVDFIKPVLQQDGRVRVFTDTGKFISQDCRHLTKAGAQYYARILDFDRIFRRE